MKKEKTDKKLNSLKESTSQVQNLESAAGPQLLSATDSSGKLIKV